jgi:hypothetical protein
VLARSILYWWTSQNIIYSSNRGRRTNTQARSRADAGNIMPSRPSMKCEDGKSEAQTLMFPSRSTYHTITSTTSACPYLLPHLSIPPLLNTTSTRTFSTVINSASMTKSNIPSTTLQPQTILFIHGALSSHQEFRFVSHSLHLQGYHILIPSLHSSGQTHLSACGLSRSRESRHS